MTATRHRIEIFEPEDYVGPNPLYATGMRLLDSPDHKRAYLLELTEPINLDEGSIEHIIIRPRHSDPIERARDSVCTVVIACVRPDYEPGEVAYTYPGIINWGIGKISVINGS